MLSRSRGALLLAGLIAATGLSSHAQAPADESALLAIARTATNPAAEATGRLAAGFVRQFSNSPVAVVARQWAGRAALQGGRREEAVTWLTGAMGGESPLAQASDAMARRWLTRLDRERVVAALRVWYADHADFPASLDALKALPATNQPPLLDRWGKPWRYRQAEFKRVRGLAGQRYVLESINVNRDNELKAALARPPAELPVSPAKIMSRDPGRESVSFTRKAGGSVVLQIGAETEGFTLAHVGRGVILLSDGEHFHVVQAPP